MSLLPNGFTIIDNDGSEYTILKFNKDYSYYEVFRVENLPGKLPRYITKFFSQNYIDSLVDNK